MEQIQLFPRSEAELKSFFEASSAVPVDVTITRNTRNMVSVRRDASVVRLRIHRIFLQAPSHVMEEISSFVIGRKKKTPLLNAFINSMAGEIRLFAHPARALSQGAHHDLKEIFDSINAEYFQGSVSASITWGALRQRRRVSRRTLGSYNHLKGVISINRLLDSRSVPGYYVRFVVYHEMLHAHMGSGQAGKRALWHSKAFREKERMFRDYHLVSEWEKEARV